VRLHNLRGLRTLLVVRDVSQRQLAHAAGYRSHAYVGRIVRGEVDTLEPEAARAIAAYLQVDLGFLFEPRSSGEAARHEHHPHEHHPHTVQA
jgi:transcriptional regulator with XRE-family HTH domain